MKSYKKFLPVFLTLALLLTAAYCVYDKTSTERNYHRLVNRARDYAQRGITYDAVENYLQALELYPSIELTIEAGNLYIQDENTEECENWYENQLLPVYPKDARTFLYGIRTYKLEEDYEYAYKTYREYQGRGLYDEEVEKEMDPIRNAYVLSGYYDEVKPFSNINGLAAVRYHDYWGYVDQKGSRCVNYRFVKADTFGEFAAVIDKEGRAFYIDGQGNVRINDTFIHDSDPDFGTVVEFQVIQSNLILAYNGSVWNYYYAETFEKRFGGYAAATPITAGVGAVSKDGEKWALIDVNGQELTGYVFDEVVADEKGMVCRTAAIIVRQNGLYYLVDQTGACLTEGYDRACAFYDSTGAALARGDTWYFLDETGAVLYSGAFEDARSFSNGMAAVKLDGYWGYIDESGELIIPAEFDGAGPFNANGSAFIDRDECWQILRLIKFKYK